MSSRLNNKALRTIGRIKGDMQTLFLFNMAKKRWKEKSKIFKIKQYPIKKDHLFQTLDIMVKHSLKS